MFASSQHRKERRFIQRVEEQTMPPDMIRFGPIYGDESEAEVYRIVKDLAWNHILQKSGEDAETDYKISIRSVMEQAMESYVIPERQIPKPEDFQEMMVKDGCLFLQLALHMLGGGELLDYDEKDPYFGKKADSTRWIPDMFFMGNQIPYCVIRALMKQPFFQNVIHRGTWRRPVIELELLILHLMVVEPRFSEPPKDVLHGLHSLISGSAGRNYHPFSWELEQLRDLEASNRENIEFPSAVELKDLGIKLRPTKEPGITKIMFRDFGYCAKLYLPVLAIRQHTRFVLTNLVILEGELHESHREVMAYLRFIMDLVRTQEDFKILLESSVIVTKEESLMDLYYIQHFMPNDLPTIYRSKFTSNFHKIRRQITEYERQPRFLIRTIIWSFTVISTIVGISSIVGSIFTILAHFHPPK